jgi:hypothetical protein
MNVVVTVAVIQATSLIAHRIAPLRSPKPALAVEWRPVKGSVNLMVEQVVRGSAAVNGAFGVIVQKVIVIGRGEGAPLQLVASRC